MIDRLPKSYLQTTRGYYLCWCNFSTQFTASGDPSQLFASHPITCIGIPITRKIFRLGKIHSQVIYWEIKLYEIPQEEKLAIRRSCGGRQLTLELAKRIDYDCMVLNAVFNNISVTSLHQCTYPCFPRALFTNTPHNILSIPLAAFPHNHCWNNK